eukprot:TRINITY_DN7809_c1_g1_i6.p2 TRINITY_DN7809_c1_g1~~TRINITY_DN7809_c1_g1_i6.p2  ORF type:complete len:105 (-),score=1.16 TRINITY_DN7809_c1_g1_i6:14-328(-)
MCVLKAATLNKIEHKSIIQYNNNKDLSRISRLENIPMLSSDFLLRDRTFNVRTKSICKLVRYWAIATDRSMLNRVRYWAIATDRSMLNSDFLLRDRTFNVRTWL